MNKPTSASAEERELRSANKQLRERLDQLRAAYDQLETDHHKLQRMVTALEQGELLAETGYVERNWETNKALWSRGFWKLLGLEPQATPPSHEEFFEFVHPDDRAKVRKYVENALHAQAPQSTQFRIVRRDGSVIEIRGIVATHFNDDGQAQYTHATYHNINELMDAEEAAQQLAHRLEEAQEVAKVGSWEFDARTHTPYWSREMLRIAGLPPDADPPSWEEHRALIHPEDWDEIAQAFEIGLAEGTPYAGEYRILQSNGEYNWVHSIMRAIRDKDGNVFKLQGTTQDIHAERMVEEELRKSEQRFRTLFDEVPIALWEEDISEMLAYLDSIGFRNIDDFESYLNDHPEVVTKCAELVRVCMVNQAAIDMHRAGSADSLLAGIASTFTERSYEVFREQLVAIWRNDHRAYGEAELRTFDGELLQVVISWSVPVGSRSSLARVIVSIVDVTEKTRLEKQLRQSLKMESIGRLAGGIAHDFNNLLTVILNYSDSLLECFNREDPRYEDLDEIRRAGKRAGELTAQLVAFSREQVVEPKTISVNRAVQSSEKMLRRLIGEHIRFELQLDPELGFVHIDPGQLNQIMINLAINARDAMPSGGVLQFETSQEMLDERFVSEHGASAPGPHAVIRVTDTGIGMDDKTVASIFDPFFTTKPVDKGTGLGLATVYGIVKKAEGTITVESQVNVGSTFKIYLPITQKPLHTEAPSRVTTSSVAGRTVLVIEDDRAVRGVVTQVLKSSGYHVLVADEPEGAIALAAEHAGSIDVVLSDVVMPRMNGLECYAKLRETSPQIKVLFMSGYTPDTVADHGVLSDSSHFIQKPFTLSEVLSKLDSIFEGS